MLINSTIAAECKVSVVIPVRNEAENLPLTLLAFANQKNLYGTSLDPRIFELIILANNCTDDSAEIVRKFQCEHPRLRIHLAEISLSAEDSNIGSVRRLLMNEAFYRFKLVAKSGVILTTDGDTLVAVDWIATNLREIEQGAEAVGGRIIIAPDELAKMDAHCRSIHLQDENYRLLAAEMEGLIDDIPHDTAPRHHQHFNGSFAVTTTVYEKAGGVPKVKFLEDVAFYDSLQRIDAKFRHSPSVQVFTSSRDNGRSEVGLAYQLNEWKKLGERGADFLVESAQTIEAKLKAKRKLREFWQKVAANSFPTNADVINLSRCLYVPTEILVDELDNSTTFGSLYERILQEQHRIGEWQKRNLPVPLQFALKDLSEIIHYWRAVETKSCYSFSQTSSR